MSSHRQHTTQEVPVLSMEKPPMLKIVFLVMALAGCCGPDDAACTQAQYNAIGASLLNRPVQTSCTNIGGIVTCTSR
jgi:hypothetical protein